MYMVSLVVFTAWIKGIKLLRFNRRITILAQTLKGSAGPLAAFSVVFLVFFHFITRCLLLQCLARTFPSFITSSPRARP